MTINDIKATTCQDNERTHNELRTLGSNTKLRSVCTREEFSLFVLDLVFNDENKYRNNSITLISF